MKRSMRIDLSGAISSVKKHAFQPKLPEHLSHLEEDDEFQAFITQKYLSTLTVNHIINLYFSGLITDQKLFEMRESIRSEEGVKRVAASIFHQLLVINSPQTQKN